MIKTILLPDDKPLFGARLAENQYSKNLVGFWPFRKAGKLVDYARGNNGLITGATWTGQGLFFDGSSYVTATQPTTTTGVTIIARVRRTSDDYTKHRGIIGGDGFPLEYLMRIVSSTGVFGLLVDTSGGLLSVSDSVLPLNEWIFLTCTYDGIDGKIYRDGVFSASSSVSGTIVQHAIDLRIGSWRDSFTEYFIGDISYVAIYNRALNASQIKDLYRDPWLPFKKDRIIFAPTAVTGAVRLIDGGLIGSGLIGGRLIA